MERLEAVPVLLDMPRKLAPVLFDDIRHIQKLTRVNMINAKQKEKQTNKQTINKWCRQTNGKDAGETVVVMETVAS